MRQGRVIADRYTLSENLADGASGQVFAAQDRRLRRTVAVKLLKEELLANPTAQSRFLREAKVATRLDHPCAVAVYDFGLEGGQPYLVMEYLHGATLRERLGQGSGVPLDGALRICAQVARALEVAHRAGLVHRDIKPANVVVEGDPSAPGRVTVIDFGLAFNVLADDGTGRQTRAGVLAGTPHYMSPEQAKGDDVGCATDVYSLGCVLYELLAGMPPFPGAAAQVIANHLYLPHTPVSEVASGLSFSRELDALTSAMLAKRPHERPSAQRVVDELEAVLAGSVPPVRSAALIRPRSERMVATAGQSRCEPGRIRVALCGGELAELAELAELGVEVVAPRDSHDAMIAVVDSPGDVPAPAGDAPVVAQISAEALRELPRYIRAGAFDVIVAGSSAGELAARLRRAAARNPRRGRG